MLEDGDTRIFLDFGTGFNHGSDYFVEWLSPRGLKDQFEFGLMPEIKGLYRENELEKTDLEYTEPRIDGIFLSHAHFDHVDHISFVDEKIPIYCGETALKFIKGMEETSNQTDYEDHNYQTFRTGDKIEVGNISVEPIHVDHSIPGAYGFLIHTSDRKIVYTGDFRLHGPAGELSEEFIEKAENFDPDSMICEGTRMVIDEDRECLSEKEVRNRINKVVSDSDKLVVGTHYGRDIDRILSFYQAAVKNGRIFAILPKAAHLLKKLEEDPKLEVPSLEDEHIRVYYRKKKSENYEEDDYYVWEREFMDQMITSGEVSEKQEDILLYLNLYKFTELIDIQPEPRSCFIYSKSEPFSEEGDDEHEVLNNWLDHFDFESHHIHASGHATREELKEIVERINPDKVFPVHTENPDVFEKTISDEIKVFNNIEEGKKYPQ